MAFAAYPHRFLLNPAALSKDHMVQFRFLGILMAVAIRTKKPLDLHLAPWVWKQLCSMPLGGPDLEEVDLLTYRTLQGILHLDNSGITEENFHVVRYCANWLIIEFINIPDLHLVNCMVFNCLSLYYPSFPLATSPSEDDPVGFVYGPQCRWTAGTCGSWRSKHFPNLFQPDRIRGESSRLQTA